MNSDPQPLSEIKDAKERLILKNLIGDDKNEENSDIDEKTEDTENDRASSFKKAGEYLENNGYHEERNANKNNDVDIFTLFANDNNSILINDE